MINRANCNLKLSKPKLLTALAWRGSYLSHNSIFKEQQSVSTQNSYAQTSNPISHLGNKKPSADLLLFNSAAQIRVLGCGDYLNRTDCQLWFLSFSLLRFVGEGRTNYQERFYTQDFFEFFLGCYSACKIKVFITLLKIVRNLFCGALFSGRFNAQSRTRAPPIRSNLPTWLPLTSVNPQSIQIFSA